MSGENKVEIKFGGDAGELLTVIEQVREVVSGSLKTVSDQVSQAAASTSTASESIVTGNRRLEQSVDSLRSKWTSDLKTIQSETKAVAADISAAFNRITNVFMTISAIAGGAGIFNAAISASQRWTGEVLALSKAMGNTTQQSSGLNAALRLNGLESGEYIAMSMRMLMAVRSNGEELERQGLRWRQAGNDQAAMFQTALKWIGEATSGIERNSRAQLVFARSAGEAEKYQKLTNQALIEGTQWATDHGLVVGRDEVEAYRTQNKQVNEMRMNLDQLQVLIGKSVLPVIQEMVKSFNDLSKSDAPSTINQLLLWMSQSRPSNLANALVPAPSVDKAIEIFERYKKEIDTSREALKTLSKEQDGYLYKAGQTPGDLFKGMIDVGAVYRVADLKVNITWLTWSIEALRKEMKAAGQDTSRLDAYLTELKRAGDDASRSQEAAAANVKNVGDRAANALMGLDEFKRRLQEVASINLDNLRNSISKSVESLKIRIGVALEGGDTQTQNIEVSYRERVAEINRSREEAMRSNAAPEVFSDLDARQAEAEAEKYYARYYKGIEDARRDAARSGSSGSGGSSRDFRSELDEELAGDRAGGVDTKRYEYARWNERLEALREGSREYQEALREVNRLSREIAAEDAKAREEARKEEAKDQEAKAAAAAAHDEALLDLDAERIRSKKELGQLSGAQELADLQQIEDRKYEIQQTAIYKRIELLRAAGELEKAEETRLYGQIEAIQDKQALSQLQTLNKIKQDQVNTWKSVATQISNTMTSAITSMLQGTQSLSNGLKNIWNQIASYAIGKIVQITAEFLANELKKTLFAWTQEGARTAAATAGVVARDGIQDASAASGIAKQAATGMAKIINDAKIAAADSYAWASSWGGPVAGAIAAAIAFAAVMAFGTLTSAAGGWSEVPSDQIAMVHKQEMVLPAHLALAIREMVDPGAAISRAVNLAIASAFGSTSPLVAASNLLKTGPSSSLIPAISLAAKGPAMALSGIGSYGIPADKLTFTRSVLSGGGLSFGSAGNAATARRGSGGITVNRPIFNFPSDLDKLVKKSPNALYRGVRDGIKRGHLSRRRLK